MSEIKYMKLRTRNAKMMKMYGDELTTIEKMINMRSNGLHTELQFTDRYGNISVSATRADDCKCVRFKMIGYSHAYRWSTVLIPVTAEQEARIFAEALKMAGYSETFMENMGFGTRKKLNTIANYVSFGPNAIKYDTAGVSLSFISKRRWWNPSSKRQWCNETCGLLLMVEWPDIFMLKGENIDSIDWPLPIPPHEQTPDETEYLVRDYFSREG